MKRDEHLSIHTAETETALFQQLVLDAEMQAHVSLSENLESYMVFLLQRFHKNANELYEPMALKHLYAEAESGRCRQDGLRDTGDSCLMLAGLFPEQAKRRMVSINYFVRLGRSSYHSLACSLKQSHAELYQHICQGFGAMLDVLHTIHGFTHSNTTLSPMGAFDLWQHTGSKRSLQQLSRGRIAIPVRSHQRLLY
ncbi:MAG: hypothetical protein Q9M17_07055 [Mariprofundus sp.]|nr:hypothetical protein [Mariprofundus sp.]